MNYEMLEFFLKPGTDVTLRAPKGDWVKVRLVDFWVSLDEIEWAVDLITVDGEEEIDMTSIGTVNLPKIGSQSVLRPAVPITLHVSEGQQHPVMKAWAPRGTQLVFTSDN